MRNRTGGLEDGSWSWRPFSFSTFNETGKVCPIDCIWTTECWSHSHRHAGNYPMTKDSISNYRTKVKGYKNASSPVNRVCGRIPRIPPVSATVSIVTFPLPLRVSEILPLLCSSTPLFPSPCTCSLPQISPCSPGSRWMAFGRFGLRRAKVLG